MYVGLLFAVAAIALTLLALRLWPGWIEFLFNVSFAARGVLFGVILALAALGVILTASASPTMGLIAALAVVVYLTLYIVLERPHETILNALRGVWEG